LEGQLATGFRYAPADFVSDDRAFPRAIRACAGMARVACSTLPALHIHGRRAMGERVKGEVAVVSGATSGIGEADAGRPQDA
jgi:hypothetical protein